MSRPVVGVGIIGTGVIARRHALAYRSLPELATLLAVADIDEQRAKGAQREHACRFAYTDYRELLAREDIQAVSICTPPQTHTAIVVDCARAGKHVLCEKPMAGTLEQADLAIEVAERLPHSHISYVFQYRSDPTHARIRHLVREGALGKIVLASARIRAKRTPAYYARVPGRGSWATDGGGVLINQAIHQLDTLISFLGTPDEVSAVMDTFLQPTEAEDTLAGWIKFECGAVASLECTTCAHEDSFAIEVVGENAQTAVRGSIDRHFCTWSLESKSSAVERALRARGMRNFPDLPTGPKLSTMRAQKLLCKVRGSQWLPPRHWGHTPHVREFLTAITSDREVPVPPREARRSQELAVALYASAITGAPVRLPVDDRSPFYRGVSQDLCRV